MTINDHTKPYQTKPYQISSFYLQLSITAISIHNVTLPFLEDRDCKPFSACFFLCDRMHFRSRLTVRENATKILVFRVKKFRLLYLGFFLFQLVFLIQARGLRNQLLGEQLLQSMMTDQY